MSDKPNNPWAATAGIWLSVLALTVATAIFFSRVTPDAPLGPRGLALVAFIWFLAVFAARWAWKRWRKKEAGH